MRKREGGGPSPGPVFQSNRAAAAAAAHSSTGEFKAMFYIGFIAC